MSLYIYVYNVMYCYYYYNYRNTVHIKCILQDKLVHMQTVL